MPWPWQWQLQAVLSRQAVRDEAQCTGRLSRLLALDIASLDEASLARTLPVLLKFETDLEKARAHLKLG